MRASFAARTAACSLLLVGTAWLAGGKTVAAADAGSPQLLWGAWIDKQFTGTQAPWDWNAVTAFEQENSGGKKISVLHWSSPFRSSSGTPYNFDGNFEKTREQGAIPFFTWASSDESDARIADGAEDAYITQWATAAKAWGHPLFLRFAHEMNGSWFPWGVGANGNTAVDYVAMWRHVHDIFENVGASNVTWVWCPNVDPGRKLTPMGRVYPGAHYVDWTCLDGYNGNNPWTSFTKLFGGSYDRITQRIALSKPMIIGEVGSTESGGSKARWIQNMFGALPGRFPLVRGLIWFNRYAKGPGGYTDWPIETSSSASAAFANGVGQQTFATNSFTDLPPSTISPPGGARQRYYRPCGTFNYRGRHALWRHGYGCRAARLTARSVLRHRRPPRNWRCAPRRPSSGRFTCHSGDRGLRVAGR